MIKENAENEKWPIDASMKKINRSGISASIKDVRIGTYYSEILSKDVDLSSYISRNVKVKELIAGAAMDTVCGHNMAIALAELGCIGFIHKVFSPKRQASEIKKVKHSLNAFVSEPICISQNDTVEQVLKFREEKEFKFWTFPVVDESKKIVGLMTRNNFDLCGNRQKKITDVMSKNIISAEEGTTVAMAYEEMIKHSVKTLPIFDKNGDFKGIYTWADVDRIVGDGSRNSDYNYNLDANGNLIVGAAIGVYDDAAERMELLSRSKVDVVAIDTAHGNSKAVVETIEYCKKNYPHIDVVAGNISEPDGARRLVRAGADGVKVGQGPGSICTTRIVTGIGCPQVEAVYACSKAIRGSGVPVCADGGIEYSGDIPILIGAGAHTVMLGKLLAGTKESPGDVIIENGKRYKVYRGMGSPEAMEASQASRERYGQGETEGRKTIAEGISGKVEYKGEVGPIIYQLLGGTKSGFAYLGAKNVAIFQRRVTFHFVTGSGMEESHPHGLNSKNTAPNYQG